MTKQSFEYTGSNVYDIDNVVISNNNIAIFDQLTGVGGVDYMPYNGSTVIIKAGDTTGSFQELAPTLNNKLYYYVSDVLYGPNDRAIIRTYSTEIPVIYSSGEFIGTFVFNNPNNFPYLYLFWDYNDNIDESTNISYIGITDERIINWNIGSNIGVAGINYNSVDTPTRFQIKWNDSVVADSGYVGLNTLANYNNLISAGVDPLDINLSFPYNGLVNNGNSALRFKKINSDITNAEIIVSSPITSSTWIINKVDPYLTQFYIDITDGIPSDVCTQCPVNAYYHNGFNLTPLFGDVIYTDSLGVNVYNGNDAYHMIDIVSCTVPSPTNKSYVLVDQNGSVRSIDTCNCPDTAVPIITQGDIYITVNEQINIPISSLGNATEFNLVGACFNYILNGGTKSSLFSYIDCNSNQRYLSVSSDIQRTICASSTPIIVSGDGSFENDGPCNEYLINPGMSLNSNGMLNGITSEIKNFSFLVTATNCFGTSLPVNINVFVSEGGLTPLSIDIEQYKETATDCCSITPSFSILYFDGTNSVPTLRNRVYRDQNSDEFFNGGDFWYFIDKSDYLIRIDNNGYVVEISVCPGSTTTTTTTSTTTIPVVGEYYEATSCFDNSTTAVLLDVTSSLISVGNIVKTNDGNCWTIDSSSTGGFPYFYIENPVVIYSGCSSCTGTTTTTSSTTTTTLPPISSFNMDGTTSFSDDYTACTTGGVTTTFYHFGAYIMPLVGDIVYSDALCTVFFDGGFNWFIADDGVNTYAVHIANTGQVLNINACSVVTTTTTTTMVPRFYYNAEICSSPGPTYLLFYQGFTPLSIGDIVKGDDGVCYRIMSVGTPGTPVANIFFFFPNCSSCIGTTTTTSTSTTTTSTTTTTTTTTTIRPLFAVLCNFGDIGDVCSSPAITYYVDGPLGGIGNNIYTSTILSDIAPANYYKVFTSSTAHEWDGLSWTGNTKDC
jgi:hypothetical protein